MRAQRSNPRSPRRQPAGRMAPEQPKPRREEGLEPKVHPRKAQIQLGHNSRKPKRAGQVWLFNPEAKVARHHAGNSLAIREEENL